MFNISGQKVQGGPKNWQFFVRLNFIIKY